MLSYTCLAGPLAALDPAEDLADLYGLTSFVERAMDDPDLESMVLHDFGPANGVE